MRVYSCDNEDCREPRGKPAYVHTEDGIYCLYCYLVFDRGLDPDEADNITFQGDETE